jgi:hypothetical protein
MIKYRYKINNVEIEVLNADSIPDGLKYETIEFEIPKEETFVPQIITRSQFKIALTMLYVTSANRSLEVGVPI